MFNDMNQSDGAMDRRGMLELLAKIAAGLSIPTLLAASVAAQDETPQEETADRPVTLDDSYLVSGLTAMVRAKGWFDAHWGAGVLAGYYLCRDNDLGAATTIAIKRQLDAVIRSRGEQFSALPEERADDKLIEEVPQALMPAIEGGLRAHGHAVIFASLSTKALRDVPQMAQPKIIGGLCGLSSQIAKSRPQPPIATGFTYPDSKAMVEATLESLLRFKGLLGHPSVRRPNFTHMVTHTEALLNLEQMGYGELAKRGHAGQKTHINPAVPQFDATETSVDNAPTLQTLTDPAFWTSPVNQAQWSKKWNLQDNPNGDWIASGHLFKVLYSYHRLLSQVPDLADEQVAVCSSVLFERYVNPNVQGG